MDRERGSEEKELETRRKEVGGERDREREGWKVRKESNSMK